MEPVKAKAKPKAAKKKATKADLIAKAKSYIQNKSKALPGHVQNLPPDLAASWTVPDVGPVRLQAWKGKLEASGYEPADPELGLFVPNVERAIIYTCPIEVRDLLYQERLNRRAEFLKRFQPKTDDQVSDQLVAKIARKLQNAN